MTDSRQEELDDYARSNGHPPVAEGVVCIDFDGTIRSWGGLFDFPDPFPGVVDFIKDIRSRGYKVYLFTSRLSAVWHEHEGRNVPAGIMEQVEYLRQYCQKFDIDVDGATAEKIPSLAYIDDKAIRFDGKWTDVIGLFKKHVEGEAIE